MISEYLGQTPLVPLTPTEQTEVRWQQAVQDIGHSELGIAATRLAILRVQSCDEKLLQGACQDRVTLQAMGRVVHVALLDVFRKTGRWPLRLPRIFGDFGEFGLAGGKTLAHN
jgi:hypothetical protein